jgi:hypothetical protein
MEKYKEYRMRPEFHGIPIGDSLFPPKVLGDKDDGLSLFAIEVREGAETIAAMMGVREDNKGFCEVKNHKTRPARREPEYSTNIKKEDGQECISRRRGI